MTVALILLALAAGYALGRARPYDRLSEWVNWQLRFHLDRWSSRPRQILLMVLLILTDPLNTFTAWRKQRKERR